MTCYFLNLGLCVLCTANANKGVTFLLLGVAAGVLGVLAVVIARLCKLYWRPAKETRPSSSSSMQSSTRRSHGDQYSPVPAEADIDGTTCVMVPVTSPPSGQQAKRSCSQLPVHWVRSESDRDPTVSNNGILRNSVMVGHRGEFGNKFEFSTNWSAESIVNGLRDW